MPALFCSLFNPFTNIGISYHACQYKNIHHTGENSEHSFMRKGYPCAQAPKKVGPSIPMPKGQGFYGPFDNLAKNKEKTGYSRLLFVLHSDTMAPR